MPVPVAVETQKNQIRFRKINGKCSVGDHINDQKPHIFRLYNQISQREISIFPEERFSAAEEENAHPHLIQLPHFFPDLFIWINDRSNVVDRTMSASQIALIGQNHSPQNRISGLEQNCPDPERSQIQKGRRFHWVPMTLASWRSILANDTPDKECYFTISWGLLIASYQKRNTNRLYSFMSNSPVSLDRRDSARKMDV